MTTKERIEIPSAERKFGQIGRTIDELLEKARVSEKVTEIRDGIVKELERIEKQFSATRAQIGQDLALTREDLAEALREELEVWKTRLGDLEVQATLGRMELRDRLAPTLRRVDAELSHLGRDIEAFAEGDVVDEESLGYSLKKSMAELRAEIEELDEMC